MDRQSYEQLIAQAKADAVETMGHTPSSQRIEHALDIFAQRVASATRSFHLLNLMGAEDVARHLGREPVSTRQLLARRHANDGIGARLGKNTWIIDIDELPMLEQDRRRKDGK